MHWSSISPPVDLLPSAKAVFCPEATVVFYTLKIWSELPMTAVVAAAALAAAFLKACSSYARLVSDINGVELTLLFRPAPRAG